MRYKRFAGVKWAFMLPGRKVHLYTLGPWIDPLSSARRKVYNPSIGLIITMRAWNTTLRPRYEKYHFCKNVIRVPKPSLRVPNKMNLLTFAWKKFYVRFSCAVILTEIILARARKRAKKAQSSPDSCSQTESIQNLELKRKRLVCECHREPNRARNTCARKYIRRRGSLIAREFLPRPRVRNSISSVERRRVAAMHEPPTHFFRRWLRC